MRRIAARDLVNIDNEERKRRVIFGSGLLVSLLDAQLRGVAIIGRPCAEMLPVKIVPLISSSTCTTLCGVHCGSLFRYTAKEPVDHRPSPC